MNYILCSTHRSGSSLLSELLCKTSIAGTPIEHFLAIDEKVRLMPNYRNVWPKDITPRSFLENVRTLGSDEHGNFGSSIMWETFVKVSQYLQTLPEYKNKKGYEILKTEFPELKVIRIIRNSKVRQAISLIKAQKSGFYNSIQSSGKKYNSLIYGDYNFTDILSVYASLRKDEENWKRILDCNEVNYHTVIYEDFVANIPETMKEILKFLGIDDYEYGNFNTLHKKQSDDINEQWYSRFTEDLKSNPIF